MAPAVEQSKNRGSIPFFLTLEQLKGPHLLAAWWCGELLFPAITSLSVEVMPVRR